MRWFYLAILVCWALFLSSCKPLPGDINPTPLNPEEAAREIVIPEAEVAIFRVEPPRSIVFSETVNGISTIWFNEVDVGNGFDNSTLVYSKNGCALAGPPIMAGDTLQVHGHLDDNGALVADIIWLLNLEVESTECSGPPAEEA